MLQRRYWFLLLLLLSTSITCQPQGSYYFSIYISAGTFFSGLGIRSIVIRDLLNGVALSTEQVEVGERLIKKQYSWALQSEKNEYRIRIEAYGDSKCPLATGDASRVLAVPGFYDIQIGLAAAPVGRCSEPENLPTLLSVSPNAGRQRTRTQVALFGIRLPSPGQVKFGGKPVYVISASESEITVLTPEVETLGAVDVEVQGANQTVLSLPHAFTYFSETVPSIAATLPPLPTGLVASDLVVADLTGDLKPDIAVAIPAAGEIRIFAGRGFGAFWPIPIIIRVPDVYRLTVGYRKGGLLDLVASLQIGGTAARSIAIVRGGTTIDSSSPVEIISAPGGIAEVETADLDNDGSYDIVGIGNEKSQRIVYIYATTSGGTWSQISVCSDTRRVTFADYDSDKFLDMVVTCTGSVRRYANVFKIFSVLWFIASGDIPMPSGFSAIQYVNGALSISRDQQGIVITENPDVIFKMANKKSAFGPLRSQNIMGTPRYAVSGDFDRDGVTDTVVSLTGPLSIALLRGDANKVISGQSVYCDLELSLDRLVAADLNENGILDVAGINAEPSSQIFTLFNNLPPP